MGATNALAIETAAFQVLNVFQQGQAVPNADAQSALGFLNRMLGSWSQQSLTIPAIVREVFPLVANKGGPSNPYTIGIGGNLNTARPPNQNSIKGVGQLLNASTPPVEVLYTVLTDTQYDAIQIKELPNTLFTGLYYNPTFTGGFGSINLWPVPNTAINSLVLYSEKALAQFANLTTVYNVPDGYEDAMVYNLARRLAKPWGGTVDSDLVSMAANSLAVIKRSNVKLYDVTTDFAILGDARFGYNINTGQ